MGKRRVSHKKGGSMDSGLKARALSRVPKRKLISGIVQIHATYNNTKMQITDEKGNSYISSSAGALGFKGTKRSTPYAASKVGELIGEKAGMIGLKEVNVIIKGVGHGREAALRSFSSRGVEILSISDKTPVPHNGPRPRKARRL